MKFLCLAYYDEAAFDALPPDQVKAIVSQCPAHDATLRDTGALLSVASLTAPSQAKSLRPRQGKPMIMDGPFTEAKEQVGSFFLIEAADLDEAVRIAAKHPAALLGEQVGWGIEVRAVDFFQPG